MIDKLTNKGWLTWLLLLLAGSLCLAFYLQYTITSLQGIVPYWNDEFLYFLDAKAHALDNRWSSTVLIFGQVSPFGQFGAHGPAYLIMYGQWMRLFANNPLHSFVLFHLVCLLTGSLLLSSFFPKNRKLKVMAIILFVSNAIFAKYTFSYMVEVPQGLFAVISSLLLFQCYSKKGNQLISILTFSLFILLFSCIRATWIFWLIGLLPLCKSKKQYLLATPFLLFGFVFGFSMFKLSHATFETGFLPNLTLLLNKGSIIEAIIFFFQHLTENLYHYFRYFYTPYYFAMKYLIVGGCIGLIWLGIKKKDQLLLATGLVIGLNWLVVICWYDTFNWRDVRVLAASFFLGMLVVVYRFSDTIRFVAIGLQLSLFCFVWHDTSTQLNKRQQIYNQQVNSQDQTLQKDIKELKSHLPTKAQTISIHATFFQPVAILPIVLPSSKSQYPITYSIDFDEPTTGLGIMPANFKIRGGKVVLNNSFFQLVDYSANP